MSSLKCGIEKNDRRYLASADWSWRGKYQGGFRFELTEDLEKNPETHDEWASLKV